jgi:hypothetical protein
MGRTGPRTKSRPSLPIILHARTDRPDSAWDSRRLSPSMLRKHLSQLLEYYCLGEWWQNAFSDAERAIISSTFQPLVYSRSILVSDRVSSSSGSLVSLLSNMAKWFMKEQTGTIAYRMIEKAEGAAVDAPILHRHFLYQSKCEIYYRFRHKDDFAFQKATDGCKQQIALTARLRRPLESNTPIGNSQATMGSSNFPSLQKNRATF